MKNRYRKSFTALQARLGLLQLEDRCVPSTTSATKLILHLPELTATGPMLADITARSSSGATATVYNADIVYRTVAITQKSAPYWVQDLINDANSSLPSDATALNHEAQNDIYWLTLTEKKEIDFTSTNINGDNVHLQGVVLTLSEPDSLGGTLRTTTHLSMADALTYIGYPLKSSTSEVQSIVAEAIQYFQTAEAQVQRLVTAIHAENVTQPTAAVQKLLNRLASQEKILQAEITWLQGNQAQTSSSSTSASS